MKNINVALIGYGKMGKTIEIICLERGHKVVCVIDNETDWTTKSQQLKQADVAIDFSLPETVLTNIRHCFELNLPIVVGTTGWYNRLDEVKIDCIENNKTLFFSPNYSLGMNITFRLNKILGRLVNKSNYKLSIYETHHIHKLDAPSGTALRLANDLIDEVQGLEKWEMDTENTHGILPIHVNRIGEVSGIHEVMADSAEDTISLKHEAKGRRGFALGAVLAAEFVFDKKGFFTMNDLLDASF